jgi:predicted ATPase with chaperone activity
MVGESNGSQPLALVVKQSQRMIATYSCYLFDPERGKLLHDAAERMRLSARGYHRVLRVARTLADLDNSDTVRRLHIAEAVSYRRVVLGAG